MKKMKAICTAVILALALSVPVYAGDINSPGVAAPGETQPPPGVLGDISSPGVTGDIHTPGLWDFLLAIASAF
jgi:hypothetical protein